MIMMMWITMWALILITLSWVVDYIAVKMIKKALKDTGLEGWDGN